MKRSAAALASAERARHLYAVGFRESALSELSNLSKKVQQQIDGKVARLGESPRPAGVEKLKGAENVYRLRSGDYRIIHEVDDTSRTIVETRIRHRKEAYRNL